MYTRNGLLCQVVMSKQEFQIQSVRVVTGLLRNFLESEKFPFLKCASGNEALNFLGNFRKFLGNFLETVRVVTGQETVRVGMWSQ